MTECPNGPGPVLPPSRFGAGYTVGGPAGEPPISQAPPQYGATHPSPTPESIDSLRYADAPGPPAASYGVPVAGAVFMPVQKTNSMAIAALVASLTVSFLGIVFGHIALSQIRRTGEGGRGLAIAGLIIGYIATAISALLLIMFIVTIKQANDYVRNHDYYSMSDRYVINHLAPQLISA